MSKPDTTAVTVWGSAQIPYSQEAEEATIGALLVAPHNLFLIQFLVGDDFFILRHRYIWDAINRIQERGDDIDYLTVIQELKDIGTLSEVGGPSYLTQLINNTPTSVHIETYARLVQRASVRRKLMSASDQIKGFALSEELTVEQILSEVDYLVAELHGVELGRKQRGLDEIINENLDFVLARMSDPNILPGIPFGFRDLDKLTLGAEKQNLIIVAGTPGMGKTSFLLSAALNMARSGKRVLFQSYEMADNDLASRLSSLESNVNLLSLRGGLLTKMELERYAEAGKQLKKLKPKLTLADTPLTLEGLRSKALRQMNETGLDAIFVDYLQIITPDGRFGVNQRTAEVTYFAYGLKGLAKELNVPIIAAAQLNRDVGDKPPRLDQLRESGAIEQAADKVIFLHRDEAFNPETEFPNQADVILAKHRNGPTGTIYMYFEKTTTKYMNAAERSIDLTQLGSGAPKKEQKPKQRYQSKKELNPFSRAPKSEAADEGPGLIDRSTGEILN